MLNREMQTVKVLTYSGAVDKYGQIRKDTPTERSINMVIKQFDAANVSNPKYVDIEYIGLTKDNEITVKNQIMIGATKYSINYIIPSKRYNQILMRKA